MDKRRCSKLPAVQWRVEYSNIQPKQEKNTDLFQKQAMCVICGHHFRHFYSLKSHIRMKHNDESVYTCYLCHKQFSNFSHLKSHVVNHDRHKKDTWKCKYCKWKVMSQDDLDRHIERHHRPKYRCDVCNFQFMAYNGLYSHTKVKHNTTLTSFVKLKCKECQRVFKLRNQYHPFNHASRTNSVAPKRTHTTGCQLCVKDYLLLIRTASHKHKGRHDLLECQTCYETIDGFVGLCRHRHDGELHRCLLCGETVQSRELLAEHTRVHLEMTPLTCNVCYKTCENPDKLSKHLCLHENPAYEPFLCGLCFQSFRSSKSISSHVQKHIVQTELANVYKRCGLELKDKDAGDDLYGNNCSDPEFNSDTDSFETERQRFQNLRKDTIVDGRNSDIDKPCEHDEKCRSSVQINTKKLRLNGINSKCERRKRQLKAYKEGCGSADKSVTVKCAHEQYKGRVNKSSIQILDPIDLTEEEHLDTNVSIIDLTCD